MNLHENKKSCSVKDHLDKAQGNRMEGNIRKVWNKQRAYLRKAVTRGYQLEKDKNNIKETGKWLFHRRGNPPNT